jgi:hypothetical protein
MLFPDLIVGDWHKGRVLDLVDAVVAQHGGPATLRYQQDVIALQETNEAFKNIWQNCDYSIMSWLWSFLWNPGRLFGILGEVNIWNQNADQTEIKPNY